jgi:hypothetical protein
MRTTITLDPDVELLLKDAMRERDTTFKEVVNSALRRGLHQRPVQPVPKFVQTVYDMGRPLVDLTKAGALADELDDLERIAKMAQGR